ncbi:MAG: VTT domain-containing protein [Chloroflexota bacterium]|nr:VTT domain-containing protein [Chloroflexota bacterium]MDE2942188.1 VTT domain-containing protein [Chloroflexota bacterium]MDE3267511.1 VTT domain-containing protein [Chloroflexota bacterium]
MPCSSRATFETSRGWGYAGVLAANVLASGTFVLPLPGLAVAFGAAAVLNPVLVALAGSTGSTLGEMAGYAAGASAHSTFGERMERSLWYGRVEGWLRRYGAVTIVALAATPTPLFDVAGFAAGSLAYPVRRFAAACWLGKTVKFMLVSLAGAWSIHTLADIFGP